MARERAGCWAVVAGLVALAGCTHHRSAAVPSTSSSPTATVVPTANAGVTPTAAPITTQAPARSPTPSTSRPGPGTPPATPSSPPVSIAPPAGMAFVITQADTGKTFTLPFGAVAELRLGGNFRWSPPVASPAIVALPPEPMPTDAGSHTWKITTTGHGTAVIESTGAPVCPPGQVCAQYVVLFRATVIVP